MGNIRVSARSPRALSAVAVTAMIAIGSVLPAPAQASATPVVSRPVVDASLAQKEAVDERSAGDDGHVAIGIASGVVLLALAGGFVAEGRRRRAESVTHDGHRGG